MANRKSLSREIDRANAALSAGRVIPAEESAKLTAWLLERQVETGRNAGAFAPTAAELQLGIRLYTGEAVRTKIATWNVLTAEAARLLVLLSGGAGDPDVQVRAAIERARSWLDVSCFVTRDCVIGECAHSLASHLRLMSACDETPALLVRRVNILRQHRDGKGRWRRFPFYYTVMVLSETICEAARSELRYAVPACQRVRTRRTEDETYGARRRALLERVIVLDDLRLL
ncbi:hypothetical protein ACFLTM_05370 [Candidatus Bipolaricaulota bacterium]